MPNYRHDTPNAQLDGDTLTHRVYATLRSEILEGKRRPGERLARHAVSAQMGVSRMPVTEALMRLNQDGLIENPPMVGARVRPLTLEELRNDQVLREALECQSARLAAEHVDDAELSRLMRMAEAVDRVVEQGDPSSRVGISLDVDLHLRLARVGGYPVLADELDRIFLRRMMRLNWVKSALVPTPRCWHVMLIEAIGTRDPDRAEAVMREHIYFRRDADQAALEAVQAPQKSARK